MTAAVTVRADGKAEMAYVGDKAWHGLGDRLEPGQPIEAWQVAAGMDWRIQRSVVRFNVTRGGEDNGAGFAEMPGQHVLFRSDSKAPLGVVSDRFKVVQPKAVLEFFRDLTESAGFALETAGTLFGGQRFWALATIGAESYIADPRDKMKRYLLLATACDGSMATEGRYVDTRVVCNNTLQASRGEGLARVKVTHRSTFDAEQAKQDLGVRQAQDSFAATIERMRCLAATPLSDTAALMQTAELVKPGALKLAREELNEVLDNRVVQAIAGLAVERRTIGAAYDGSAGTQYGWLNAVTQYVDHEARAREPANRFNSAMFGKGAELKQRAFAMAGEAADAPPVTDDPTLARLFNL